MNKKLIVMDLDGTLAESKSSLSTEMSIALKFLLKKYHVAVISGGMYEQFQKQLLGNLNLTDIELKKLYLFPTCATKFYQYDGEWKCFYSEDFSTKEREKIFSIFEKVLNQFGFQSAQTFGSIIEDRGSQITFSALGQSAPIELKKLWDPDQTKRLQIINFLKKDLPEFEVRIGGSTSIDITKKGIDKAYGIQQIEKYLGFKQSEMLFIGDALYKGGNDYPVKSTGIDCIKTSGPEQTINIIHLLCIETRHFSIIESQSVNDRD